MKLFLEMIQDTWENDWLGKCVTVLYGIAMLSIVAVVVQGTWK